MGRPNQVHDTLDALLDGRPGEVTDDLAPLLAAAEALRAELADLELDPEVADRHLERALDRPAPVVTLPVRKAGGRLRRRVAAVALAAALVLVPATMASASALPGQGLYPVKLAVEQVRLVAVQWSPTLEAQVRTGLAATRLQELDELVQRRMFQQVPSAIRRLDRAVVAARAAVMEAVAEGAGSRLVAVADRFKKVAQAQHDELVDLTRMANLLPAASREAIVGAVTASPAGRAPISTPVVQPTPSDTPSGPGPTPDPDPPPRPEPTPSTAPPGPTSTDPPPPPSTPSSTEPRQSTTTAPTTTVPPTTVVSQGGSAAGDGSKKKTAGNDKSRSKSGTSSSTGP
jgi:hypothetical protein